MAYRDYSGPARMHQPISKRDLTDYGRVNSEPEIYHWTEDQIKSYFKEKYPNLKPPTNSSGKKQTKPVSGFVGPKDKQKRRARKQPC